MSLENGFDPDPRLGKSSSDTPSDRSSTEGMTPGSMGSSQFSSSGSGTAGPGFGTSGYASPGGSGSQTLQSKGDGQWRERSAQDRRIAASAGRRDLANTAKAQASGLLDYARSSVQSALSGQQNAAAESMHDLAGALRVAGRQLEQDQRVGGSRLARHAADTLEQVSGALREKDLGTLARDVEGFARRQPAAFIGAAMFAGFLAMRFLKSGQPDGSAARPGSSTTPIYPGTDNRNLH